MILFLLSLSNRLRTLTAGDPERARSVSMETGEVAWRRYRTISFSLSSMSWRILLGSRFAAFTLISDASLEYWRALITR
jgi:hypothetical protein